MKKIIVSLLALSVAAAVNAQEIPDRKADHPPMMHKGMGGFRQHHGMDLQQLNLSEDQKAKFKAEKENFRQLMEDLKKSDQLTVKVWREKMESIRKEHHQKMQSILSADQKAQLEKMKTEGKARHEEMMKKRDEMMKTRLGLTDDQAARLEKGRKETGEKIKAIREDKSLSEDKKREQIRDLMKSQHESLKSILTEEQLKKMKEGRKSGPPRDGKRPEKKETI